MKTFISDEVFLSPSAALTALSEALNKCALFGIDGPALLRDNLPTEPAQDDAGNTVDYSVLNLMDNSEATPDAPILAFVPDEPRAALGAMALVTLWDKSDAAAIKQEQGDALARPVGIYLLHLPTFKELTTSAKLQDFLHKTVNAALLSTARKIAKADAAGTSPLVRDRITALINAQTNTAAKAEAAFAAMFTTVQSAILGQINAKAEALKAAGHAAKARALLATFPRARLDKPTLKACLSSEEAAKLFFPTLPQTQWENILRFCIAYAPKFKAKVRAKDADGNQIKDAEGKIVYHIEPKPLPTTIFQQWLDTRKERLAETPDDATFTFDGLDALDHVPASPASPAAA